VALESQKKSTPGSAVRRPVAHGVRSSHSHSGGRWKLVYADFVTVLMAFFIVAWIFVFDKLSRERVEFDTRCTLRIGKQVEEKFLSDLGPDSSRWPIEVDYSGLVQGTRFTLQDVVEPMFERGSARLSKYAAPHLDTVAESINQCPGLKVSIEGYTDSSQYAGGDSAVYGNWELSVDRASTARRELLARGIDSSRIDYVRGFGDSRPALREDPLNARNRRISITVLASPQFVKGWGEVVGQDAQ
jgi:chemotaxis protein MotB